MDHMTVSYLPLDQRRNARVIRVTFNERLNILVLGSWPLLHIASTSVIFDRLFGCLEAYYANQYVEIYTLACSRQFSISCGFEECNKRSKVAINHGSLLSSWFVWGAIAQQIAVVIIKRMKLVVVYKARGARANSVLHVKHKATWCFNLWPFDPGIPPLPLDTRPFSRGLDSRLMLSP